MEVFATDVMLTLAITTAFVVSSCYSKLVGKKRQSVCHLQQYMQAYFTKAFRCDVRRKKHKKFLCVSDIRKQSCGRHDCVLNQVVTRADNRTFNIGVKRLTADRFIDCSFEQDSRLLLHQQTMDCPSSKRAECLSVGGSAQFFFPSPSPSPSRRPLNIESANNLRQSHGRAYIVVLFYVYHDTIESQDCMASIGH